jgi:hypothetical protein
LEWDGLQVTREKIKIEPLILPDTLKTRYFKEYDVPVIQQLAKTIQSGVITPHALVVKEVHDTENTSHLELLHKPSIIFALKECGIGEVDVVVVHRDDFDLTTATDHELFQLGKEGAVTDHIVREIPMVDVLSDESIIDEKYRDVLKDQMSTGQLVNIRVRARQIWDRTVYDIIDGYHRYGVLKTIGAAFITARVTFGMTNEELFDERVLAAFRSAKAVKYARMITSMQFSYAETVWKKDYDLRLSQIISWAMTAKKIKQPGKNLGIPEEAALQAIAWVNRKAILWNSEVGSLYQQIRAAENSFPDIIRQVRTSESGGHASDMAFNATKFIAIAEQLPGDEKLQVMMVAIIKRDNLTTDQVRVISKALAKIRDNKELTDHFLSNPCDQDVLSGILGGKVLYIKGKMVHEEKGTTAISDSLGDEEYDGTGNTENLTTSSLDELAPIEASVTDAESDTIFIAPPDETSPEEVEMEPEDEGADDNLPAELKPVKSFGRDKDYGPHQDYNKVRSPTDYEREILELQTMIEKVTAQLAHGGKRNKSTWYETLATLTLQEREVMRYITMQKKKGKDMYEIDAALKKEYSITSNQLSQMKRSALSKWSLFFSDLIETEYNHIVGK